VVRVLLVESLPAVRQRHVAEPEGEHPYQVADHVQAAADLVLGDGDIAHERDPDAECLRGKPHVLDRRADADHLEAKPTSEPASAGRSRWRARIWLLNKPRFSMKIAADVPQHLGRL
jgi:hypothetical protein